MGLQTDQTDSNVESSSDYLNWMKTGQTGQATPAPAADSGGGGGAMPPSLSVGALMPGSTDTGQQTKSATPPSMEGLMAATSPAESTPQFLGSQSGALRPLGQRLGIMDSTVLASLGRRPY